MTTCRPGATDPQLTHFSVAHDEAYILPALRAARKLNPRLYLEGVPWSPPGWMKTNDGLDNFHHAGALLPRYYRAFANYFVKFVQAYAAAGRAGQRRCHPGRAQRAQSVSRDAAPPRAGGSCWRAGTCGQPCARLPPGWICSDGISAGAR